GVRPDRHWLGSDGQRASIAGSRSLFREKGLRGPLGADTRGDPDVQPIARKEDRALSRDLLKEMLAWVRLKAHPAIRAGETEDAMIHATCHTADNVVCLEFDATPWFNEAAAPSIVDLARHGWSSAAIAESLERRRGYERLHDLIDYAAKRLQPESLE